MNIIRAVLFNIALAIWTVFIALLYIPTLISSRASRRVGRPWAKGTLLLARLICGIDYRILGENNIQHGPVIYASKHQSALEITILMSMFPAPAFVLKKALLYIPFFGTYLWRMQMIAIDRKAGASALKQMMGECIRAVRELRPIAIFPEGTRISAGEKGQYHPGVAAIYQQLKIPVVPVAVNTGLFWPRNRWHKKPGTAIIEFLPQIPPGLPARAFLRTLEESIETASRRLYESPPGDAPDHEKDIPYAPLRKKR